jgi:hypothetical protein
LVGHVPHETGQEPTSAYYAADHLRRKEQSEIDAIVGGQETGHYWLFIGPKGGGKSNMVLEAMAAIDAEGVSVCEAHPDLEVFRLRLGKALNFEYNEDTQTVRNPFGPFNWQADINSRGSFNAEIREKVCGLMMVPPSLLPLIVPFRWPVA